jgi:hypothetical protein
MTLGLQKMRVGGGWARGQGLLKAFNFWMPLPGSVARRTRLWQEFPAISVVHYSAVNQDSDRYITEVWGEKTPQASFKVKEEQQ